MILNGHVSKALAKRILGPCVDVTHGEQKRRRLFWPVTVLEMNYSSALRRLREAHGPTARFKREDQAGIESWQAITPGGVVVVIGAPDWALLLSRALGARE